LEALLSIFASLLAHSLAPDYRTSYCARGERRTLPDDGLLFPQPSVFYSRTAPGPLGLYSIMSGLEILGVAASALQVAQVTLDIVASLTVLFNQIRDAPKLLQARLVQVQTLIEISRLIASMPQLQTAEVEAILQSCSRDAGELKDVLQSLVIEQGGSSIKKWIRAVGGAVMEKRIIGLLHNLEVGKSALTLCITRIDS
jgi:hypothetical protein